MFEMSISPKQSRDIDFVAAAVDDRKVDIPLCNAISWHNMFLDQGTVVNNDGHSLSKVACGPIPLNPQTQLGKMVEEYSGPIYGETLSVKDALDWVTHNDCLPVLMLEMVQMHALVMNAYEGHKRDNYHYVREFCGSYRRAVSALLPR